MKKQKRMKSYVITCLAYKAKVNRFKLNQMLISKHVYLDKKQPRNQNLKSKQNMMSNF